MKKDARHLLSQTGCSESSSMTAKSRATGMEEDGGEAEILVQKKLCVGWARGQGGRLGSVALIAT